jgi:hypothetical protein
MQTLVAGWPNDPKIIATCLTSARQHGPATGINREVAKRYLLHRRGNPHHHFTFPFKPAGIAS